MHLNGDCQGEKGKSKVRDIQIIKNESQIWKQHCKIILKGVLESIKPLQKITS